MNTKFADGLATGASAKPQCSSHVRFWCVLAFRTPETSTARCDVLSRSNSNVRNGLPLASLPHLPDAAHFFAPPSHPFGARFTPFCPIPLIPASTLHETLFDYSANTPRIADEYRDASVVKHGQSLPMPLRTEQIGINRRRRIVADNVLDVQR